MAWPSFPGDADGLVFAAIRYLRVVGDVEHVSTGGETFSGIAVVLGAVRELPPHGRTPPWYAGCSRASGDDLDGALLGGVNVCGVGDIMAFSSTRSCLNPVGLVSSFSKCSARSPMDRVLRSP
jgi:hypothetical protein